MKLPDPNLRAISPGEPQPSLGGMSQNITKRSRRAVAGRPAHAQPAFSAYSRRCDRRSSFSSGRQACSRGLALYLSVPNSEGPPRAVLPTPARNSSNASPEKSSAACSMNVASASETPYGSIPSAPAASQNARSSALSSDRDKRAQRRATSLSDKPAAASLAATPSMNFARIDSAAPRDSTLSANLPETQIGVRGGELLSPDLERRAVEPQRHVWKGEPRTVLADRMLSISTAENRPPVRREAFSQMHRRAP